MAVVASKIIRLDKLAEFANNNFDRKFDIPYAVEIEQHSNELDDDRFVITLHTAQTSVITIGMTSTLPRELVEEKFKRIENCAAGYGPGIELLGIVAWYWLLSNEDKDVRDLAIKVATEAWDAWTLATAVINGSKDRDKFEHTSFVCPGVTLNQNVLCLSIKRGEQSIWLKRSTVRRGRYTGITSRWTFSKPYLGANDFFHEEKHAISEAKDAGVPPAPLETIMRAKDYPFNP